MWGARVIRHGMRLALIAAAGLAGPATANEARFDWFDYAGSDPVDATLRIGPGQYRNPILPGFYPDPSLTRAGEDYYLVNSTFAWFPGIPVFHSRDLVHWTQIGNAIDRPDMLDFRGLGLSRGVFAPAISHHDGTFYIVNTCVDCGGNYVVTARDPAGPWSDPVWLPDLEGGIDPSLFFDADGRAWIVNNGAPEGAERYPGHRAIWIQQFDPVALRTTGARRVLVDSGVDPSANPRWIEGPHLFHEDGFYYLICAEGGTEEGHSEVVLRSTNVTGPYAPDPGNPILTQRDLAPDRPFPITSAGHADFVRTPAGDWWATFLAVRPYRDNFFNTGRETFLLPVTWRDGWPRVTAPGEAIPYVHASPRLAETPMARAPAREEFDGAALGRQWMMMRNPGARWYRLEAGSLVIEARPAGLGDLDNPAFLARRQQHMNAAASTLVRFAPAREGDEAGLAALQNDEYWYAIGVGIDRGSPVVRLRRRAGGAEPADGVVVATAPRPAGPVRLRIEAEGGTYRFAFAAAEGPWHPLGGDRDGTVLSTQRAGGFVGTMIGLYARTARGPEPASAIRLNQLGFFPGGPKRAMLPSPSTTPLHWRLLDGQGIARAEGETQVVGDDAASGEHLHLIDFSRFDQPGENYRLIVAGARSHAFRIAAEAFGHLPADALEYFYHSRASASIEARYVGERWARPAGHAPDRATCVSGRDQRGDQWDPCPYTLDVSKGWYDAGDQGKYVVNGGIAAWTLLDLYERGRRRGHPPFPDGSAAIPEAGNHVDDLLDEARWEVEFLLSMQVPEGTHMRLPVGPLQPGQMPPFREVDASGLAHHKVADEHWTPLPTPPQLDRVTRYLYPPTTAATLNLAAVAAQCARIWRDIDAAFSARCLGAARRAYEAAKRNPELFIPGAFSGSGGYFDRDVSDEFFWAAAELYATAGEATYLADLRASPHFAGPLAEPAWPHTAALGAITLALVPNGLPQSEVAAQRARITAAADRFLAEEAETGYRVPLAGMNWTWGSNSFLLNRAILLALAFDFSGEARYRNGVIDVMDYLLGRNPLDQSYVSGYGARPMANPHHRFWAHSLDPGLPPPPPGVLSGGANAMAMADPVAQAMRGHCAPMTCWRDDIHAFSMNEIAINWNAPLVWVAEWLAEPH